VGMRSSEKDAQVAVAVVDTAGYFGKTPESCLEFWDRSQHPRNVLAGCPNNGFPYYLSLLWQSSHGDLSWILCH